MRVVCRASRRLADQVQLLHDGPVQVLLVVHVLQTPREVQAVFGLSPLCAWLATKDAEDGRALSCFLQATAMQVLFLEYPPALPPANAGYLHVAGAPHVKVRSNFNGVPWRRLVRRASHTRRCRTHDVLHAAPVVHNDYTDW